MTRSHRLTNSNLYPLTLHILIVLALVVTDVTESSGQSSIVISSPRRDETLSTSTPTIRGLTSPGYTVTLDYCANNACTRASALGYEDYITTDYTGKFSFSTSRPLADSRWDWFKHTYIPHTFRVTACLRRDRCQPEATVLFYTDTTTKTPKWHYPTDGSCLSRSRLFFNIDAESGSSVYLSINGQPDQRVNYSSLSSNFLPLSSDGEYTLILTTMDGAGNRSSAAEPISITVDSQPPAPPVVIAPTNGQIEADSYTAFRGYSEPNAGVIIKIDQSVVLTTKADSSGAWVAQAPSPLPDGVHSLSITASDCAGNKSSETTLNYRVGPLPPPPSSKLPIADPSPPTPGPAPILLPPAFLVRQGGVVCGFVNERWEPGTTYPEANLFISLSAEIHHATLRAHAAVGDDKPPLLLRVSQLQNELSERLPVCGQLPIPKPTPTPTATFTHTPTATPAKPPLNSPLPPGPNTKLPKDLERLIPRYSDFIGHLPTPELYQAAALFGIPLDQILDSLRQSENYLARLLGNLLQGNLSNLEWIQAAGRYSGSLNTNPDGILVLKGTFDKQRIHSQLNQFLSQFGASAAVDAASSNGVRELKGLKNASGGKAPAIYVTVLDGEAIVISSSKEDLITAISGGFSGVLPGNLAATVQAGTKVRAAWSAGAIPAPDRQSLARWISGTEQAIKAQSATGKSLNLGKLGNIAKELQSWGLVVDVDKSQTLNLSSKMTFSQSKSAQLTKSFARDVFKYYTDPKGMSARSARLTSHATALKETKFKLTVKGGSVVITTRVPKSTATKWNPPN